VGEVVQDIVDDGCTGFSLDRRGLNQVRNIFRAGVVDSVDAVVAFEVDRLSRRLSDLLCLGEEFRGCGLILHFVRHPTDPGAAGCLFLQTRGAFAEYERQKFLERCRCGMLARARAGQPGWGNLPYGYRYVSNEKGSGLQEVVEGEGQVVQEMFRCLVEEGLSVRQIAPLLNGRGIRPKRGRGGGGQLCARCSPMKGIPVRGTGKIPGSGSRLPGVRRILIAAVRVCARKKDGYP